MNPNKTQAGFYSSKLASSSPCKIPLAVLSLLLSHPLSPFLSKFFIHESPPLSINIFSFSLACLCPTHRLPLFAYNSSFPGTGPCGLFLTLHDAYPLLSTCQEPIFFFFFFFCAETTHYLHSTADRNWPRESIVYNFPRLFSASSILFLLLS